MKVALYNRWLPTLGGGEKHSLAIADFLSRGHEVAVLSHEPVSKEAAMARLRLDLSRVEFRVVPDCSVSELERLSAGFDLFINASFMTYFPVRARHNILLIYFPTSPRTEWFRQGKRLVGWGLKKLFLIPTFQECLYQIKFREGDYQAELGDPVRLELPEIRRPYTLHFSLACGNPLVRRVDLALNGTPVERLVLPPDRRPISCRVAVPRPSTFRRDLLVLKAGSDTDPDRLLGTRFFLQGLEIDHPRYRGYKRVLGPLLREWGARLHNLQRESHPYLDYLGTYSAIWANSAFTRKWIARYWDRPAEVLYPPIDVDLFYTRPKKNRILSVGRFFAGGHNKKHQAMIRAFTRMLRKGLNGWELHLAGGTMPQSRHQKYLEELIRRADSLPIHIHPDIGNEALLELYAESAVYWHASGFGENENRHPFKFEHFGITTVEAMAAGCVPVVIGKGGQVEIVRHGENGFLWQSLDELEQYTGQLIQDDGLRERLSAAALKDSRLFGQEQFNHTLEGLLQGVGVAL